MGFERSPDISAIIRGWHHGRIRATRSARARELLTKLMPALLEALAKTADPLSAFTHFDRFLSGLPSGVQVFSMLLANPKLLDLIAEIAGSAPKLADYLGRHAGVLDALIDPGFLAQTPSRAELQSRFAAELALVSGYEAALDAARRFAKEENFRIGVQIIQGMGDAGEAGPAYAAVAETVIAGLQGTVMREMVALHGRVAGGAFAVVAQGKLGGREMTAASDLDLVFVYNHASDAGSSDGAKPLSPSVYYAKAIFEDARVMREKLAAQFPGSDIWDIKFAPGGLVDIEFIAQALQLREASRNPDILDQNSMAALEKLMQAGALDIADAQALISAAWLEHGLTQVLRIALEGPFKPEAATRGLKALLARAGEAPDFPQLERHLAATQARVHEIFTRLMDPSSTPGTA